VQPYLSSDAHLNILLLDLPNFQTTLATFFSNIIMQQMWLHLKMYLEILATFEK
jgi:hypothetical protein